MAASVANARDHQLATRSSQVIKITGSHELCLNLEWVAIMAFEGIDWENRTKQPRKEKGKAQAKR